MMRAVLMLAVLLSGVASADGDDAIINFSEYSPLFASAGQPSAEQLATLSEQGYRKVIYIAYSDHERSLANEDRVVKQLGMSYVHIPVEWNAPTAADFALFASAMQQDPDARTLLHCQMNYRASAFAMLYRVLYLDVPLAEAKRDMNAIWQPNQIWTDFMRGVLADNGVDPDCDGCDWSVPER